MGDIDQFYPLHQICFPSRHHSDKSRVLARDIAVRSVLARRADGSLVWDSLPPAAAAGDVFAARSKRGSSVAVVQGLDTGLWLMRVDSDDPKVRGRIWREEMFVADNGEADVVGVRRSVAFGKNVVAPTQRSAALGALVNNCALLDDKTLVQAKPRTVTTYDVLPVLDLVSAPARRLPVLLLDPRESARSAHVASQLAGFTHVLTVGQEAVPMVEHGLAKAIGVHPGVATLCWPASAIAGGAVHMSWNAGEVEAATFWPSLVSALIRSSVGSLENWLGPLAGRLQH